MCGRFVRNSPADVIIEEFGVTSSAAVDLAPRYNVCPGEIVAAVVQRDGERRLGGLRWGFELPPLGSGAPARAVINVRSETAATRGVFAEALRRRRCLVVADGFYEWHRLGPRSKAPYFIRLRSRRPFAFAGIWQRPLDPASQQAGSAARGASVAILTCEPNALLADIHDRMPVVLTREGCDRWLDPERREAADVTPLLAPLPADALEAWEVSPLVNSPRNDAPELVRPV